MAALFKLTQFKLTHYQLLMLMALHATPDNLPIEQVRTHFLTSKQASEDDLKKIDAAVRAVVAEAAEFASRELEPDAAEIWTDVLG